MSQFTPLEQEVITAAYSGKSLRELALMMGMNYGALCWYEEKHPVFSEALQRARAKGWLLQADKLLTIYEDNPDIDFQRLRGISENTKWLLERMRRDIFGQQIEIHNKVTDVRQALEDARKRVITVNPVLIPPNPLD